MCARLGYTPTYNWIYTDCCVYRALRLFKSSKECSAIQLINLEPQGKQMGKSDQIKVEIENFHTHILEYRKYLNEEGVWLFLATLGCWSVKPGGHQYSALLLTAVIFGFRLYSRISDKRTFPKIANAIRSSIASSLKGDANKARLYELEKVEALAKSNFATIKQSGIFLVCWLFYIATFLEAIRGIK